MDSSPGVLQSMRQSIYSLLTVRTTERFRESRAAYSIRSSNGTLDQVYDIPNTAPISLPSQFYRDDENRSTTSLLTTPTATTYHRLKTITSVSTTATAAIAVPLQLDMDEATAVNRQDKRKRALLELLSSERAYASDLALMKSIHVPLSRGLQPLSQLSQLPMDFEASKAIFRNIDELADFADMFSERLEHALGKTVEGGSGEDHVGELFLEMIPLMSPLYKTYITRHTTALVKFQSLPPTLALTNYINLTRQLAAPHTNAWGILNLLIKPVQRLLGYPLLLSAIHSETSNDHPDKPRLQEAITGIEKVARNVNESRRGWEVTKGILTQGDASNTRSLSSREDGGLIPGRGAASPKTGQMQSFRSKIRASLFEGPDHDKNIDEETEMWETKINDCELLLKDLARDSLQWSREVRASFAVLRGWNSQFGSVVGLGESGIEAIGAFGKVIGGLLTFWLDLDHTLQNILLPQLQKLVSTLSSPQILLAHMHTLRQSHVTLLNTPYNKSRPPIALMEASDDYLALQATLREELPSFFTLFEKGLTWILVEFSRWQTRFWQQVREYWLTFWIALAVEGGDQSSQINGVGSGAAETTRIWWEQFEEVEQIVQGFRITNRPPRARKADGQPVKGLYQYSNDSETTIQDSRSSRSLPTSLVRTTHTSLDSNATNSMRTSERQKDGKEQERSFERERALERALERELTWKNELIRERERAPKMLEIQQAMERITMQPKKSIISPPPPPPPPPLPRRRSSRSTDQSRPVTPELEEPPAKSVSWPLQLDPPPPPLYSCVTLTPFLPPRNIMYMSLPFLQLYVGDTIQVFVEAGHPSEHVLPILIDDGDDCLLVARDEAGRIGWTLASFVMPLA